MSPKVFRNLPRRRGLNQDSHLFFFVFLFSSFHDIFLVHPSLSLSLMKSKKLKILPLTRSPYSPLLPFFLFLVLAQLTHSTRKFS